LQYNVIFFNNTFYVTNPYPSQEEREYEIILDEGQALSKLKEVLSKEFRR